MLVRVLPARGASLRRLRPASPAITLASPVSPQAPGVPLLVSGTYAGQPGRIGVVWRQGGLDVGAPVDAAVIGGGAWSATLVTPAIAGTYTLRAAFDGTTPTADSAPILIEAAQPGTLGSFGFEGTGAPADTIALFGHAFEQGTLQPADPVVLRTRLDPHTVKPVAQVHQTVAICADVVPGDDVLIGARSADQHAVLAVRGDHVAFE